MTARLKYQNRKLYVLSDGCNWISFDDLHMAEQLHYLHTIYLGCGCCVHCSSGLQIIFYVDYLHWFIQIWSIDHIPDSNKSIESWPMLINKILPQYFAQVKATQARRMTRQFREECKIGTNKSKCQIIADFFIMKS